MSHFICRYAECRDGECRGASERHDYWYADLLCLEALCKKKNLIAAIIWKPVKQVSILENSFHRHRRLNKISWSVCLLLTHFKPSRIFTGEAGAYLRVVHSKLLHLSMHLVLLSNGLAYLTGALMTKKSKQVFQHCHS